MGGNSFQEVVKRTIVDYWNNTVDTNVKIGEDDIIIVWLSKTIQNNKALAITTLFDGFYYEITFNGDKDELYLDIYKKADKKVYNVIGY